MELFKEETSQQGSPKRPEPSVAAWSCNSLCHPQHMCRAAKGVVTPHFAATPNGILQGSGETRGGV